MMRRPFKGRKEAPTCSESRKINRPLREADGWDIRDSFGSQIPKSTLGNGRHIESYPYMSMNAKQSVPEDVMGFRDYLAERYTAQELIVFVRENYDPNYLAFFGVGGAMVSYLTHIRDDLGLDISMEDIEKIAGAIVERGDIRF